MYIPKNGIFWYWWAYYTNDRIKALADRNMCAIPGTDFTDKGLHGTAYTGWNAGTITYNGHSYTHAHNDLTYIEPWVQTMYTYGVDVVLDISLSYWTEWSGATYVPPWIMISGGGHWPSGLTLHSPAVSRNTTTVMYEELFGTTFDALEADSRITAFRWENGYDQFVEWLSARTSKPLGQALTTYQGSPLSKVMTPNMSEYNNIEHRLDLLEAHTGGAYIIYEIFHVNQVQNAIDWGDYIHSNYPTLSYGIQTYFGGTTQWADYWGWMSPLNYQIGAHHGEKYSREIKEAMGVPFDFTELLWTDEWWFDPVPKAQVAWTWEEGLRLMDRINLTGVGSKPTWNTNSTGMTTELLYNDFCRNDPGTETFNFTGNELLLFKNTRGIEDTYSIVVGGVNHDLLLPVGAHGYIEPTIATHGETTVTYSKDLEFLVLNTRG